MTVPKIKDDRTPAQCATHTTFVGGFDRFLSSFGPGLAEGGSWAVWACLPADRDAVEAWVIDRGDINPVEVWEGMPRVPGLLHVYVIREGHPAVIPPLAVSIIEGSSPPRWRIARGEHGVGTYPSREEAEAVLAKHNAEVRK